MQPPPPPKKSIKFWNYVNKLNTPPKNDAIVNESFLFFSIWQTLGKQTPLFSSDSETKNKRM